VASEDCAYSMLWMQVRQTNREHGERQAGISSCFGGLWARQMAQWTYYGLCGSNSKRPDHTVPSDLPTTRPESSRVTDLALTNIAGQIELHYLACG
jgi:hypothetical protein